jgi:signal transduction histidine kinase
VPRHGVTAQGIPDPEAADQAPRRRRGLSRWPIGRKLLALVMLPLLVIIAGGTYLTVQAYRDLRAAQAAETITGAASASNQLSQQLQRELITTLTAIDKGNAPGPRIAVRREWQASDAAFARLLTALSSPPDGRWDYATQARVDQVRAQREKLADLRNTVFTRGLGDTTPAGQKAPLASSEPSAAVTSYGQIIEAPRQLTQRLGQRLASTAAEGKTVDTAASIAALAEVSTAAAQEVTLTDSALIDVKLSNAARADIDLLRLRQSDLLALARVHGTDAQQKAIDGINVDNDRIKIFRTAADDVFRKDDNNAANRQKAARQEEQNFRNAAAQRLTNLDETVAAIVADGQAQASDAARAALTRLAVVGGGGLLLLLLVIAITTAVARSVSNPLRRLRSAAVETANVRLPAAVQQIDREGPDAHVVMPPALPPGDAGGPETAEVARAVDGLTGEAVRLASAQVRLRRSLDDAFVSMSRRSQSMVEKQLAIIDELERTEEDPDQLRNLFRLDHLAARMRRYNDNLLVLAGSVVRTRSNAPVPIADVFRAATSEMEQYERVRLQPVSGAAVSGPAAGGLIHLLAELLDNAAMYSPPTSPILMAAAFTADGALRLEITDSGVGIPGSELAELNMRLASPGSFDMQVPSRMGLYVVARLAQRGGFGVQLAQRNGAAGTVAEVLVPAHLVIGGSGLIADPSRASTSPSTAVLAGPTPAVSPARGVPALAGPAAPSTPDAVPLPALTTAAPEERETTPVRRPFAAPVADADEAEAGKSAEAPATAPAAAVVAATEEPLSPLPSRRPGAALAGGPLGATPSPAPSGPLMSPAPSAPMTAMPSPFAAAAGAPPEAPPSNGSGSTAGRAGGGFGAPGRPFAAGTPAATPTGGRRATGAGAPSAATAAAAAAAARAARAGGSTPAASALFAARGPATDGRGSTPVPAEANGAGGDETPAGGLAGEAPLGADADGPLRTTGSTEGPPEEAAAPAAWEPAAAAAAARAGSGTPGEPPAAEAPVSPPSPEESLSGSVPVASAERAGTPIFDTISTWFSADTSTGETDRVIDLRDRPTDTRVPAAPQRWSSLGDQRWLATNARAAAAPEVAGSTEVGLPRRRPGANLIPSAAAAAPLTAPATRPELSRRAPATAGARAGDGAGRADADAVRGRLSSYQRGLTSARRARHLPGDRSDTGLFAAGGGDNEPGQRPESREGD